MGALPELRAARRAWREARAGAREGAGAGAREGALVARLWALHAYVNTRFRIACRGAEGDNPTSAAWQRLLHRLEESLDTAPTAAQHLAWSQCPTMLHDERLPAPTGVEALGQVRRHLDENHPNEHTHTIGFVSLKRKAKP